MSPEDLFVPFAAPLLGVLLWVAAGIGAAMTLYMAVVGIRMGLGWFLAIVEERRGGGLGGKDDAYWNALVAETWASVGGRLRHEGFGDAADLLDADAEARGAFVGAYIYEIEHGMRSTGAIAEGFQAVAELARERVRAAESGG